MNNTTLKALRQMRKGVLEQGYPSRDDRGCHYWKHNRKCVIGMICPDEDLKQLATYDGGWQTICTEMPRPWMDDLDPEIMTRVQDLHDELPDEGWLVRMVRGLDRIIKTHEGENHER